MDLEVPCCQKPPSPVPMFRPVIYDNINRRVSPEDTIIIDSAGVAVGTGDQYNNRSSIHADGSNNDREGELKPHYVTFKYHHACPDGLHTEHLFFNEKGDSTLDTKLGNLFFYEGLSFSFLKSMG